MCPDETLLTAYVDDEVPSPWTERIEMHLGQCERCRSRVAQYRALRSALRVADAIDDSHLQEAAQRIQASLDSRMMELSRAPHRKSAFERYPIFYMPGSKRISVPLPVLAASLLLFVFFAGLAFGFFGLHKNASQAFVLSTKLPADTSANIESLVSTLSQTDPSMFVTIKAPENISQPLPNTPPVYVIYNTADQKPTVMAVPAQGEAK